MFGKTKFQQSILSTVIKITGGKLAYNSSWWWLRQCTNFDEWTWRQQKTGRPKTWYMLSCELERGDLSLVAKEIMEALPTGDLTEEAIKVELEGLRKDLLSQVVQIDYSRRQPRKRNSTGSPGRRKRTPGGHSGSARKRRQTKKKKQAAVVSTNSAPALMEHNVGSKKATSARVVSTNSTPALIVNTPGSQKTTPAQVVSTSSAPALMEHNVGPGSNKATSADVVSTSSTSALTVLDAGSKFKMFKNEFAHPHISKRNWRILENMVSTISGQGTQVLALILNKSLLTEWMKETDIAEEEVQTRIGLMQAFVRNA